MLKKTEIDEAANPCRFEYGYDCNDVVRRMKHFVDRSEFDKLEFPIRVRFAKTMSGKDRLRNRRDSFECVEVGLQSRSWRAVLCKHLEHHTEGLKNAKSPERARV
jgi:hypothetical protein